MPTTPHSSNLATCVRDSSGVLATTGSPLSRQDRTKLARSASFMKLCSYSTYTKSAPLFFQSFASQGVVTCCVVTPTRMRSSFSIDFKLFIIESPYSVHHISRILDCGQLCRSMMLLVSIRKRGLCV